ncbi:uncharacterized protein DNG_08391 [Cephalotrichum gorgonifer]|uniref:Uncharacterized protein n=1 Tax=Cephalotrichum gorgonifer TaxID=2041049 RepID=A0AAE8N516_9PEZI|nr:uncharacterized protein DNG_08391 [Cephalotrichum gorgonifer]
MKLNSLSALTPSLAIVFTILLPQTLANTEKTIFIAPNASEAPGHPDGKSALYLTAIPRLTGTDFAIRANVSADFPSSSYPDGAETWVLLDDMTPGQRYEARIMWAATQPTSFTLDAFSLPRVMGDEKLLSSLSSFQSHLHGIKTLPYQLDSPPSSKLLLRIQAKADYFTDDEDLMNEVPGVLVDIALDPYVLNAVPQSLVPVLILLVLAVPVCWTVALLVSHRIVTAPMGSHSEAARDGINEKTGDSEASEVVKAKSEVAEKSEIKKPEVSKADTGGRRGKVESKKQK